MIFYQVIHPDGFLTDALMDITDDWTDSSSIVAQAILSRMSAVTSRVDSGELSLQVARARWRELSEEAKSAMGVDLPEMSEWQKSDEGFEDFLEEINGGQDPSEFIIFSCGSALVFQIIADWIDAPIPLEDYVDDPLDNFVAFCQGYPQATPNNEDLLIVQRCDGLTFVLHSAYYTYAEAPGERLYERDPYRTGTSLGGLLRGEGMDDAHDLAFALPPDVLSAMEEVANEYEARACARGCL